MAHAEYLEAWGGQRPVDPVLSASSFWTERSQKSLQSLRDDIIWGRYGAAQQCEHDPLGDLRESRASRRISSSQTRYKACYFAWSAPIDPWMTLIQVRQSNIALIRCDISVLSPFPRGAPRQLMLLRLLLINDLPINRFIRVTWPPAQQVGRKSFLFTDWDVRIDPDQDNLVILTRPLSIIARAINDLS